MTATATKTKKLAPITHGTHAGYELHRRRGQAPCQVCADANRARSRNYREQQQKLAAERAEGLQALLAERILGGDKRWHLEAACAGMDVETFYPPKGGGHDEHTRRAVEVCETCPLWVKAECLADALAEVKMIGGSYGIRAGLTPDQRRVPDVRKTLPTSEERSCIKCGRPVVQRLDEANTDFDRRIKCGRICPLTDAQIGEAEQHAAAGGTLAVLAKRWKMLVPTARRQFVSAARSDLVKAMDSNVGRSR